MLVRQPLGHLASPPDTAVDESQFHGLYSSIHTHTHVHFYLPVFDLPQFRSPLSLSENEASTAKQTQIIASKKAQPLAWGNPR